MYPEREKNPEKIERILRDLMNPADGADFCHRIVFFGREVCTARSPRCDECRLRSLCEHGKKAVCGTPCDKNVRKNDD